MILGGLGSDLRAVALAAVARAGRGAQRAHPLRRARRDGRAPARLGAADARDDPAPRRRPACRRRARPSAGARAPRLAVRARAACTPISISATRSRPPPPTSSSATACRSKSCGWAASARSTTSIRALVLAAREAMVNAARHSGAPVIAVYLEVEPDQVTVFVRDRGRGFDPRVGRRPTGAASPSRSPGACSATAAPRRPLTPRPGHRGRAVDEAESRRDATPGAGVPRRRPPPVPQRRAGRAGRRRRRGRRGVGGRRRDRDDRASADPTSCWSTCTCPTAAARSGDPRRARRASRRPLPRAVGVGRARGRDRGDPRRRAGLRHQDDLGPGAARRHPPRRRRRRGVLTAAGRLRARRVLARPARRRRSRARPAHDPRARGAAPHRRGYAYKEIARQLDISTKTVETHVSSVLRKLQLSNRHELTRWATERRIV